MIGVYRKVDDNNHYSENISP